MKKKVTINYNETILEVVGEYESAVDGVMYDTDLAGSEDEPSTFSIDRVLADGYDITGVFFPFQIEDMQLLALNEIE